MKYMHACFDVNIRNIGFICCYKPTFILLYIVNDITTSPSNRIRSCDQPILYAKHLSKYLHGNPAYSFLDTDVIPENIVILIKQCCDGRSCNKYVDLNVLVSVDGKPEKFIITECKTCSK